MAGIDYGQLRQRVSMTQVLELIGFRVTRRRGSQLRGVCPIPGCSPTSGRDFSVHLDRQVYHCFACHSHGNALDLWAAVHCLPLYQAAVALCQATNLTPPQLSTRHQFRRVPFSASSRNH
jgi:DNA primase